MKSDLKEKKTKKIFFLENRMFKPRLKESRGTQSREERTWGFPRENAAGDSLSG